MDEAKALVEKLWGEYKRAQNAADLACREWAAAQKVVEEMQREEEINRRVSAKMAAS